MIAPRDNHAPKTPDGARPVKSSGAGSDAKRKQKPASKAGEETIGNASSPASGASSAPGKNERPSSITEPSGVPVDAPIGSQNEPDAACEPPEPLGPAVPSAKAVQVAIAEADVEEGLKGRKPRSASQTRNLVLLGLGLAAMWLPLNYSFYRSVISGEGEVFAFALFAVGLSAIFFIAVRKRFAAWLARRTMGVVVISTATLATNSLLLLLPYLPLSEEAAFPLRLVLVAVYEFVFALLFFAWVRRLADALYQASIVRLIGCTGLSITGMFLLVNFTYETPVFSIIAAACLFASGLCWQLCTFESVQDQDSLRLLPTGRSMRRWSLLLLAFFAVALLHAVMFAAQGAVAEQSTFPTWLQHTALILLCMMFAGVIPASTIPGLRLRLVFSIIIILMVAYYLGILSIMAAPGALTFEGGLAVMTVVQRTLRIFIFLALIVICYQDFAAVSSTFGLLFLLVEVVADVVCYVVAPAFFQTVILTTSQLSTLATVTAIVLMACFAGFLILRLQEWHEYFKPGGMPRRLAVVPAASQPSAATGSESGDGASDKAASGTEGTSGTGASADSASAGSGSASGAGTFSANLPAEPTRAAALTRRQVCDDIARRDGLTERETDVLYYLSLGYSVKKIADTLYVSANTVATHSSRLYRKMGVHSRQELIDQVNEALGVRPEEV